MCDTNPAEVAPVAAWPASAKWAGEVLALKPVDELSALTVCDNIVDMLLPHQGPAKRLSPRERSQSRPRSQAKTACAAPIPARGAR
jgi:hypothetical protein